MGGPAVTSLTGAAPILKGKRQRAATSRFAEYRQHAKIGAPQKQQRSLALQQKKRRLATPRQKRSPAAAPSQADAKQTAPISALLADRSTGRFELMTEEIARELDQSAVARTGFEMKWGQGAEAVGGSWEAAKCFKECQPGQKTRNPKLWSGWFRLSFDSFVCDDAFDVVLLSRQGRLRYPIGCGDAPAARRRVSFDPAAAEVTDAPSVDRTTGTRRERFYPSWVLAGGPFYHSSSDELAVGDAVVAQHPKDVAQASRALKIDCRWIPAKIVS